jgi:hypothetical protein
MVTKLTRTEPQRGSTPNFANCQLKNGSTLSGLCNTIYHIPWVSPMAMIVKPLRGITK